MSYKSTFDAIDNLLRKEAGCSNELDYTEQTSWVLFLRYLEEYENGQEAEAVMADREYTRVINGFYRWSQWAYPTKREQVKDDKTGKVATRVVFDDNNAMRGEDLVKFVEEKLFPHFQSFKNDNSVDTNSLQYKIGQIFSELTNKIKSPSNMRDIIDAVQELHFATQDDLHEMSLLYEDKIRRMGNAGRNGGEYYTPRPLIKTMIKCVDPHIGESIYDPACGSAGFLCEAFAYLQQKIDENPKSSIKDTDILQNRTFTGKEKKGLPYIIAIMNMIFHGVKAPNIIHTNTLTENVINIDDRAKHDIILANPPFGGQERDDIYVNFPHKTSETSYLFMQHFIKKLRAGGRAAIVIKNTFLSNGDAGKVRKMLLDDCHVDAVLDLPQGVFQGAGVKSIVIFFTKGKPSDNIWYYQLTLGRTLGKTNPLNEDDLADFRERYAQKSESENSWTISVSDLNEDFDMSVKNPNAKEIVDTRTPKEIANIILNLSNENNALINEILNLL